MVAGLLLPAADDLGALAASGALWDHIRLVWREQQRSECWAAAPGQPALQAPMPLLLWARCVDDTPPPQALQPQIQRLAEELGARLLSDPTRLLPSLEALLQRSTLLMLLPPAPGASEEPAPMAAAARPGQLRFQRHWDSRRLQSPPHHTTLLAEIQPDASGLRWSHHPPRSSEQDDMAPRPRSRRQQRRLLRRHLGHWSADWAAVTGSAIAPGDAPDRAFGGAVSLRGSEHQALSDALSDAAWQSERASAWALDRGRKLLAAASAPLLAGSLILVILSVLSTALAGRAGLVLSLALLAGGAGLAWMLLRERRQEARQWWCLGRCLLVQDIWHRFALADGALQRFLDPMPGGARPQRAGPLLPLLEAHQLALASAQPPPPWDQLELTDVVIAIKHRIECLQELRRAARRRSLLSRAAALGLITVLMLVLLDAHLPMPVLWLKLGLLCAVFQAWMLALLRPPTDLPEERLRRHQGQLLLELRQLEEWQRGADLHNRHLRAAVEASVLRLGQEELDLARDGLEAAPW